MEAENWRAKTATGDATRRRPNDNVSADHLAADNPAGGLFLVPGERREALVESALQCSAVLVSQRAVAVMSMKVGSR
jgi:hypothetical protein